MVKLRVVISRVEDVGKDIVRVPASFSGAEWVELRGQTERDGSAPAKIDFDLSSNEIAINAEVRKHFGIVLGKEYDFVVHATDGEPKSTELTKLYRMASQAADADPGEAGESPYGIIPAQMERELRILIDRWTKDDFPHEGVIWRERYPGDKLVAIEQFVSAEIQTRLLRRRK